ncbi:unnamed protein product [Acanthoscelides obtectus]|uniref:Uncharacterized protein n=1 Tax=Acanthoscelides obtectus TaxID=200917 RepID=A0A9P0KXW6_ACAOB|nr:unnamed protein product [Acanthoscelides obtectus]CAK1657333.1 hypothetical protein AOBTE_LOCUS20290 [Acanthoscelides obtectus]
MNMSTMTLVKIAAIGGVATVTMGILAKSKVSQNVTQTEFYKDALKTVRTHKGVVHLLGEPIKDLNIDVDDTKKNYCTGNSAKFEVPVKGSKQKGRVYFWADKNEKENKWIVKRIELELNDDKSKRLLVKSV